MSRGLSGDILNAIAQETVYPFFAVDLLFDAPNQLYFWTGVGELVFEGVTYTGAGELVQISDVQEGSDLSAKGATLTLSGIPSSLLTLALAEDYQNRTVNIRFGLIGQGAEAGSFLSISDFAEHLLLNDAGDKLDISSEGPISLYTLFAGYMDQLTISSTGEMSTISMTVESRMLDLERPRVRRYTDQSQQSLFPGDLGFEFVTRMQSESLEWS
jgi:hypothetical protein